MHLDLLAPIVHADLPKPEAIAWLYRTYPNTVVTIHRASPDELEYYKRIARTSETELTDMKSAELYAKYSVIYEHNMLLPKIEKCLELLSSTPRQNNKLTGTINNAIKQLSELIEFLNRGKNL
jgi:hypothetical protein